jgi:segregation and condensation protein B
MDQSEQRRIVEALILASPEPIPLARLAQIVPELETGGAKDLINELNTEYADQDRSFEIWEVAGGYQIRTRAEFSGYLQQLRRERPLRLSQASLETLAIIAYKQPVTRAEIEDVRGVDSGAVVKTLLDRRLVRITGHREVPGRPLLYGTSKRFLEIFGLESIRQLPSLRELEELAREQGVVLPGGQDDSGEGAALEGSADAVADERISSDDDTASDGDESSFASGETDDLEGRHEGRIGSADEDDHDDIEISDELDEPDAFDDETDR